MFFKKNKALQELGFYNDQEGILDRYHREGNGWNTHLENTKKYICNAANTNKGKTAAVLGSGWLLDVPVKKLSEIFEEVHLFDIIHPKEIKQKIKRYNNVHCIEKDLTGGFINGIYQLFQKKKNNRKIPLDSLEIQNLNLTEKYDFVSSVNILNQLDIILVDYIKEFDLYNEEELSAFRKKIQIHHINSLPKGKTCLITDFEEIIIDNEITIEKKSLIYAQIPEGSATEQWQWNFDSKGFYNKDKKTIFNVVAMNL